MTPDQTTYLTSALGHSPSDFEQKLYVRLEQFLNRQPSLDECVNMRTDVNLIMWVQMGL